MEFNLIATLISFTLYLLVMLGIGWHFYSRTNDLSDYVLGGRKLNAWVTSLSAQASDMSGWLLIRFAWVCIFSWFRSFLAFDWIINRYIYKLEIYC